MNLQQIPKKLLRRILKARKPKRAETPIRKFLNRRRFKNTRKHYRPEGYRRLMLIEGALNRGRLKGGSKKVLRLNAEHLAAVSAIKKSKLTISEFMAKLRADGQKAAA